MLVGSTTISKSFALILVNIDQGLKVFALFLNLPLPKPQLVTARSNLK